MSSSFIHHLQSLAAPQFSGVALIRQFLAQIDNPQFSYRTIHIAGTNGKGSTASMISSVCIAGGHRTGLLTSPHLIRINERYRMNNKPVSDDLLWAAITELDYHLTQTGMQFSYIELITILGFLVFRRAEVDVAVIEVGVGGRLDPTNVLRPLATVITPISLDHQNLLGPTLMDIAPEKAGIMHPAIPCVCATQETDVRSLLISYAAQQQTPIVHTDSLSFSVKQEHVLEPCSLQIPTLSPHSFVLPLLGAHQQENARTALLTCHVLREQLALSDEHLHLGLQNTTWHGRLELLSRNPLVLADGAHNEAGFAALGAFLTDTGRTWHGLCGFKEGKNLEHFITHVLPHLHSLTLTASNFHPMDPQVVAQFLQEHTMIPITIFSSVEEALSYSKHYDPLLITGSLYLLGDVYSVWFSDHLL